MGQPWEDAAGTTGQQPWETAAAAPTAPGLLGQIGQQYDRAVAGAQDIANQGVSGTKSMPATYAEMGAKGLGLVGTVGGDVINAAVPDFVKNGFASGIGAISSVIPQSAKDAVSGIVGGATKYYNGLPQNTKDALDAVGNTVKGVTTIIPAADAISVAQKGLGAVGDAMVASGDASAATARQGFAQDLVSPLNDTKAARIDAVGNTEVNGILNKATVQPTSQEIESAGHVAAIPDVSPSNTIQGNYNAVNNALGTEAESLKNTLDKSGVSYMTNNPYGSPQNAFKPVLNRVVQGISSDATLTGDAQAVAAKMANKMSDFVDANPPTPSGLLQARKQFDNFLSDAKTNAFDPATQSAFSVAGTAVRNAANQFIAQSVPSADVAASLAKQSSLYRALENIAPKAAAEAPTAIGRLGQKLDSLVPVKTALIKGAGVGATALGLGAGAIAAPGATAAILGTGSALYGAGKLITAPATRSILGRAIQKAVK